MRRPQINSGIAVSCAGVIAALMGALLPHGSLVRASIAASVTVLMVAVGLRSPRHLLYVLLVWLPALGMLRRMLNVLGAADPIGDPLLLVAPAAWAALATLAVTRGALRHRTAMTTAVLVLTGLLTVSAINPRQGGLAVGLAGLFLVVPPMLAFWVGRTLVDDQTMRRVISLIAWLALPGAAYGLIQTFIGFPSWDARWIVAYGYTALNVGGVIRAFASFASAAEYASFLAIGVITWIALGRNVRHLPLAAVAVGLLGTAIWFESSRGIIVLTLAAAWLVFASRGRLPLRWALLGGVALLVALPWLVGHIAPEQSASNPTGNLSSHQTQGLSDPFGQQSTLPTHIDMAVGGIREALTNPLGTGVGAVTSAAGKYGGIGVGTEADPGNAAVAAGALGLVTYVIVVLLGLPLAYRVAARRRDIVAVAALGILCVTFMQWLNGAQYAVAPLPWLMLGWLDRHAPSGIAASKPED